jgi:cellulose biosynthesis protein BcsQ
LEGNEDDIVFQSQGGVGKATMLFNVAVEMGVLGKRVLMVYFDAQANLTAISLSDEKLEKIYDPDSENLTVAHAFAPLVGGSGDVAPPPAVEVRSGSVWLVPGDIKLSDYESIMPGAWTEALAGQERGFRVTSAPYRLIQEVAKEVVRISPSWIWVPMWVRSIVPPCSLVTI